MATLQLSNYHGTAANWEQPNPDYLVHLNTVGAGNASNTTVVSLAISNMATRSPVVLGFILEGDPGFVHIGHSPHIFNPDPTNATTYDSHIVVLVGNDLNTTVPVVLSNQHFTRIVPTPAFNIATITGAQGFGANPPVLHTGPHQDGAANTDALRSRRILLLPYEAGPRLLSTRADGRYGLAEFYNTFIQPGLADANVAAQWAPVEEWFRLVATNGAAGTPLMSVTPVTSVVPAQQQALNAFTERRRVGMRAVAGVVVPAPQGLTDAAFNAGMASLRTSISESREAQIAYERNKAIKTFTDRHGEPLAQRVQRLTGANDDATLPEVHQLLASSAKHLDYGIITNALKARAAVSPLPCDANSAPVPSTSLVINVFRNHLLDSDGLTLGKGLTPFGVVCEHHDEARTYLKQIQQASMSEAGGHLSLGDADALISTNQHLPLDPQEAVDKLVGFSILVDVYFGTDQAISRNLRDFVTSAVAPMTRMQYSVGRDSIILQDYSCRILFEVQQEMFYWIKRVTSAANAAAVAAINAPTFERIQQAILTHRLNSLATTPVAWDSHKIQRKATPTSTAPKKAPASSNTVEMYSRADNGLLKRFQASGHSKISDITKGHEDQIPKHGNSDVCLNWALKGKCSSKCARSQAHRDYPKTIVNQLHKFLDLCGVAKSGSESQE